MRPDAVVRALSCGVALCVAFLPRLAAGQEPCEEARDWRQVPVRYEMWPVRAQLRVGDTATFRVQGFSATNVPCRPRFTLTSSDVNVARVRGSGASVVGVGPGVAILRANVSSAGGSSPRAVISVGPYTVVSPGLPVDPKAVRPPGPPTEVHVSPLPPRIPVPRTFVFQGPGELPATRPTSDSAWLTQAARIVDRVDESARSLVQLFRATAGIPVHGATTPSLLSNRERARWEICQLAGRRLRGAQRALRELVGSPGSVVPGEAPLRAARELDTALRTTPALEECGRLIGLIRSPDEEDDWQAAYEAAAEHFYHDWYAELRASHEAALALARAVRPLLPPGRVFVIPAPLPATPPTLFER